MNKTENYYNNEYFNSYQKKIGEFGGKANLFKFKEHINKTDSVLDFGCGGGFLLNEIDCKYKAGVEINEFAANYAKENFDLDIFSNIDQVENEKFDVILSNHALEHCDSPITIVKNLYSKLKKGGKIIIVVPLDSFKYRFKENDVNKHLYSFSQMNLGNILQLSGFIDIRTYSLLHKWPPFWYKIQKIFGWRFFHFICFLYGTLNLYWTQSKAIGYK